MKDVKKNDFLRIIKKGKEISFTYYANGNDELNPCGTVKRQATYEFYVRVNDEIHLIVYKQHRRTHDTVEKQLLKRYSKWAIKAGHTIKK